MRVTFFHRKVLPKFHFSVEIFFDELRSSLPSDFSYDVVTSQYYSQGLLPRLYNALEAFVKRGSINHITGDVNYVGIFLPTKTTIHTILDCVYMQKSKGLKRFVYRLFWLTIPIARSRFVTTISESSKSEIVEFTRCNPEKIKVIPISLSPVYKKTPRSYQWEKPRVLMVGSAPNKNLPNIIHALKGIDCKVQIVGKFEPKIKQLLEEYGMEHTYESGLKEMHSKYLETDILVFASTYEGFGMPIIEAQAMGIPVVTSKISSMPEVAGPDGAVFVDPHSVESIRDGVLSVVQNDRLREQLIETGYENVRRFEMSKIVQMYVDLYKEVASS